MIKSEHRTEKCAEAIVCPYCQKRIPFARVVLDFMVNVAEVQLCKQCDKRYHVAVAEEFVSTPDCELNDQEHSWCTNVYEGTDKLPRLVYTFCTQCDQVKA